MPETIPLHKIDDLFDSNTTNQLFAETELRERQRLIEAGNRFLGESPKQEGKLLGDPDDIFSPMREALLSSPLTQIAGGVRDAAINTVQAIAELTDMGFASSREFEKHLTIQGETKEGGVGLETATKKLTDKVPEIPKTEDASSQIARSAAQYAIGFIPIMKGLKTIQNIPRIGGALQSGIAGMLTAFSVFDPDTPKFGEMIESLHPKLKLPLLDFLKAKPDDSDAEKRFKNSIDDALAFGVIGGIFFAMGKMVKNALALNKKLNAAIIKPKVRIRPKDEAVKPVLEKKAAVPVELEPLAQEAMPIHLNRETVKAMTEAYRVKNPVIMNRPIALVKEEGKLSILEGEHRFFASKQAGVEPPMVVLTRKATDNLNAPEIDALARKVFTGKNTKETTDFYNQVKAVPRETIEEVPKAAKAAKLVEVTEKTTEKTEDFLEMNAKDTELAKKTLNLNFENWKVEDDLITSLNKVATLFEDEAKAMGRGVTKTRQQLLKEVEESGFGIEQMLALNKNQPINDNQVKSFITHLYHVQKQLEAAKLAFKAGDEEAGKKMLSLFALSGQLVPKYLGAGSTMGRGLKAFDTIKQDFDGNLRVVKDLINATEEIPLGITADDFVKAHDMIPTVKGRSLFARIATTASDMFMEAWIAGLVSGTKTTFGVNIAGNLNTLFFGLAERGFASGRSAIFGGGKRGIAPQEAHYLIYGMINSIGEAFHIAGKTLRTGIQHPEFTKFDIPRQITSERVNLDFIKNENIQNIFKKGIDGLGTVIRMPFTVLGAGDDFFKTINSRGHLWALGARKANSLGLEENSEEWLRVVANIIRNPTRAISDQAADFGHIQTFTNVLSKDHGLIEGIGASVTEAANRHSLIKMIVPFAKIATNITKYSLERTPFALLMKDTRAAIARGGADREMVLAKIAVGSMIGMFFVTMAKMGIITGTFPTSSSNLKQLKRDSGVDQNSVLFGGKSFPYRRVDPAGLTMGMAADIVEMSETLNIDELSEVILVMSTVISENLLNKSYLVGISDIMDVMLGRRSPSKVLQRTASTLVPFSSLIREAERAISPETGLPNPDLPNMWDKFLDGFMSGKPGENRYLMPKRSFFGEILERGRYFDVKNVKDDKALNTLIENEVNVAYQPDRTVAGRKRGRLRPAKASDGIVLDSEHYDRMLELFGIVEIGGLIVRESIEQIIDGEDFKRAPKSIKADVLESIIRHYRDVAEIAMLDEDEESGGRLNEMIRLKKIEELRGN